LPSLPYHDHILLHRLWAFATLQDDLLVREHAHLLDCEECRAGLRVCMKAENFGAVLKTMRTDSSEGSVEVRPASSASTNNAEEVADNALPEVRTPLALGLFMPHEQARRGLIALMASEDVPTKIRSAASKAMNNGKDDVSDKGL
jgi:hypothetical protein